MTNLPKIALGVWAWGNDGTFGTGYTEEQLRPIFDAAMEHGLLMGSSSESVYADPRRMLYLPVAYPIVDRLLLSDLPFMGLRGARCMEDALWNGSVLRRELSVRAWKNQ